MSEKNISEWAQEPMKRLGLILLDLMDIEQQLSLLHGQKKAKQEEAKAIKEQILANTGKGKTIFESEE